jgi:hypothetical protein
MSSTYLLLILKMILLSPILLLRVLEIPGDSRAGEGF